MVVLKVMVHYNVFLGQTQKRRLYYVSMLVILASLAEFAGVRLDGAANILRPLHIAVKILELSAAPAVPYVCASILQRKSLPKICYYGLAVQALLEILSGFFGWIFYVDADNFYVHGPFYMVYVLALLSGILFFTCIVLLECRKQYGIRRILLLFLPTFAVCGLLIQYA